MEKHRQNSRGRRAAAIVAICCCHIIATLTAALQVSVWPDAARSVPASRSASGARQKRALF
jgi:hypothetical protein